MSSDLTTAELPPLAPMDVAGRVGRLRAAMVEAGLDALVVTKPPNVRWLTGFTGSNGTVVVTGDGLLVITDGRYRTQIAAELAAAGVEADVAVTRTDTGDILDRFTSSASRVGLEAHHVTWKFRDEVEGWLPGRTLVAADPLVERLRVVKDDGERSRLARAAAIADRALAAVAPSLVPGITERRIARDLDSTMLDLGADAPSYDTIVAGGPNSALPHARPTDRALEAGDFLVIDVGARLGGYGSDMTRTFVIGAEPTAEQHRLYDAVIASQAAGVAAVVDGVDEVAIDRACRDVLDERELVEAFIHGTGHGIGLEIHEDPFLSARSTGILRSGSVVTVEPGVYLPDRGGVRIEDSVVITPDGCEPITLHPKTIRAGG